VNKQALREALIAEGMVREGSRWDAYPPIRVPRNWRPPHSEGCDDDHKEWVLREFPKAVETFAKRMIIPALKQRGWRVTDSWVEDVAEVDEDGVELIVEVEGKAGQTRGLGGRKYIVLDRNVEDQLTLYVYPVMENVEFHGQQQFDVDEFAEWTWDAECPVDEIRAIQEENGSREHPPTPKGVQTILSDWDRLWIRDSKVRSKIQKKADLRAILAEEGLLKQG